MHNLVTFIGRVTDSMLLVASMDNSLDLEEYNNKAKEIIRKLNTSSPARCTIEAGQYYYHYYIEDNVCYLTLADRTYPKRLAYQYLEELQREFHKHHGADIHRYSRPYAANSFDPKMNRIRKEYLNPHAPRNRDKVHNDLTEIHNIMVSNIQEVLKRGEKLEHIQDMSSTLLTDSKRFDKYSKYINYQYMLRTYGPIVAVVIIILLVIYWKLLR